MKFTITLLCLFLLTACNATTKLSGFVDPNYRNNFTAKTVLVAGSGMTIEEQKALEDTFIKSFEKYDVAVLRGLEIFPPTRDYSNKDMVKIARNNGADTILLVSASDKDVSETYVPPTYHPGTSRSYVSGYGNYATVSTYTSPGYTTGGYSVSKPGMNVSASLINTKNKETIWTAEGFSGGNGFSSFSDLAISTARTSVAEIANAGLIAEKTKSEGITESPSH